MLKSWRVAWVPMIAVRLTMITLLAAAAPDPVSDRVIPLSQFSAAEQITLRGEVFHVQGLDLDADSIFVTSVDTKSHRGFLHRFSRDGVLTGVVDLTDGARYHVGGISLAGDRIWIPVAEYRPDSTSRIVELDKKTLGVISSLIVGDHIGAVTFDGVHLYGANWDAARLYIWNRDGTLQADVANPTRAAYQDMKFVGGSLVASGITSDRLAGTIDWLDPVSFARREQLPVGRSDEGEVWTQEGMALADGHLYLLPRDGHDGIADVYVFDLDRLRAAVRVCGSPATGLPDCILQTRVLAER